MQVGDLARRGAARVDHDDPVVPRFSCAATRRWYSTGWHQAALRADQHDQVGLLEILVAAGHHVRAEGAAVAGDRRGHAEPRIGVDVGGADEALHQLVGDVVVLGQELAGDVEGDRVRPVLGDRCARNVAGDQVERLVPARAPAADLGMEQPAVERRASRRAPRPSSRAGRNWPDGPGRRRSSPSRRVAPVKQPQPTPQ